MTAYTKIYLSNTIQLFEDEIHDLEVWSAFNKDQYHEEIQTIKQAVLRLKTVKRETEEHDKNK